jgi:hypothetical protein
VDDSLSIALSNAVAATVLALLAIAVSAVYRRPALVHGLWLLVLLKLVTPPLVFIPVVWPTTAEAPPLDVVPVQEEPTNLLPLLRRKRRLLLPNHWMARNHCLPPRNHLVHPRLCRRNRRCGRSCCASSGVSAR